MMLSNGGIADNLQLMSASPRLTEDRCVAAFLGRVPYWDAWELQRRLHSRVARAQIPDQLLLLEHPHVYTLGKRGKESDVTATAERLKELGAEVHRVDRGGQATYHGPGQLVGYPIIGLRRWGGGPLRYVQALEQVLITTLAELGIDAQSEDRPIGVWVGDAKIAAIGVRISQGVTMHGFALNVCPDLSYFGHIVPCGIPDGGVTSISKLLSKKVEVEEVAPALVQHFGRALGLSMEIGTAEELGVSGLAGVASWAVPGPDVA